MTEVELVTTEQTMGLKPVVYDIALDTIAKMDEEYSALTIIDVKDTAGYKAVHEAQMIAREKRLNVEAARKVYKGQILGYGRMVDGRANELTEKLSAIEDKLRAKKQLIDDEKARLKKEKEEAEIKKAEARIDELSKFNKRITVDDARKMSDNDFKVAVKLAEMEHNAEQERIAKEAAEKKAEAERLEAQRIAQEAEAKKLADERAELEAKQKAFEEEKAKVEADKKANEDAKQKAIDIEKAKKEAVKKAKEEEEAKAKKEAERLARIERLKPDREKIVSFANSLKAIQVPEVTSPEAIQLVNDFKEWLSKGIDHLQEKANTLQ